MLTDERAKLILALSVSLQALSTTPDEGDYKGNDVFDNVRALVDAAGFR